MQVNIIHDGALTVELESDGTVTPHVGGACSPYHVGKCECLDCYRFESFDNISERDQAYIDSWEEK